MRFLAWVLLIMASAMGFENHEAKEDAAVVQLDGFFGSPRMVGMVSGDEPFTRAYGYSFFPITKIASRDLVGSAEFSALPRRFQFHNTALNGPLLQSYGVGMGYETVHAGKQLGFAYGMMGVNGDLRDLGPNTVYGDVIYTHQYYFSERLMFGGGIDLHLYFGDYYPYPVILLDWQVAEHTKIKIDFDTGEVKQFLTDRLSLSLGAQYDLFHYGFGRSSGYVMETISSMLQLEFRIGENTYARIAVKKPFWGGEKAWTATGEEGIHGGGISLRMQFAYGV